MKKKVVTEITLMFFAISMLTLTFNNQSAEASGTIYIRADGSIDPPTANITTTDNVTYTFTGNINDSIAVERDNIVVDGAGYTVQGTGSGYGIDLSYRSNVTIKNTQIEAFQIGIHLYHSHNNIISGNNITENNSIGIASAGPASHNIFSGNSITNNDNGIMLWSPSNSSVSGNSITENNWKGIYLNLGSYNIVSGNTVTNNTQGIYISSGSYNIVSENALTNNSYGIYLDSYPNNNTIYHNNLVNNTNQVRLYDSVNVWDDDYPSGGNYWSDYTGVDLYSGPYQNKTGSDGIGDVPYDIGANNTDHYPLINPWPDITPPVISILSPQNTTYPTSSVPLTFTVNEATSWIGYSLDNQVNVTIAGNTTLTGLAIGPHNVIVYANDTYGNMGSSDKVYFTRIVNDVAILNVTASPTETYVNQIVNINVTVKNKGTVSETFNVTAYYDSNPIDTQSVVNLAPMSNITITFSWNTTDVQKGNYTISAYAWPVPGETDTDDNLYIDGIVQIVGNWTTSFIGLGGYPIVDFAVYNGKLYAAADNTLYMYDGSGWNVITAPTFMLSLEPYQDKLVIGGKGGLYSYDGTTFTLIFTVPNYIKALGVYNNTLYAGTVLDKPPTLYYCNGQAENPDNWHVDIGFSAILKFSGPFGSIDSFAAYSNSMYVTSGGIVYSYNGTSWNITKTYNDVCAYLDMKVYNGKLYLATRDQAWRKPYYLGYSGFGGRVIEFDGNNWTTVFDHDYWIYSLETYGGKLYAGTANKIYTYNGTRWDKSFNSEEAYYAISLATFNNAIYAGMGNGYILADPSREKVNAKTTVVPEFPSIVILLLALVFTTFAVITEKKRHPRKT